VLTHVFGALRRDAKAVKGNHFRRHASCVAAVAIVVVVGHDLLRSIAKGQLLPLTLAATHCESTALFFHYLSFQ
jgi:hypothetical protein